MALFGCAVLQRVNQLGAFTVTVLTSQRDTDLEQRPHGNHPLFNGDRK